MDATAQNDYRTLKANYRFTKDDEALLLQVKPHLESVVDEFLEGFYEFIWNFGKTAEFLKDEDVLTGIEVRFVNGTWIYSAALMIFPIL